MDKINWCKKQEKGIRIIEPNKYMANEYFKKSDDALKMMSLSLGEWKIVSAYYACYNATYALMQKAGIKCEIHDCSISLMTFFGFAEDEIKFMKILKKKRIDAQYYVNKKVYLGDTEKIKDFVLKCKNIAHSANFDAIRQKIIERIK